MYAGRCGRIRSGRHFIGIARLGALPGPVAMRIASDSRVIPANEYRRERWRNQLGWTREICRSGDAGASLLARS